MRAVAGRSRRPIDELERTLFAPEQPATVLGDPDVGLVATVDGPSAGARARASSGSSSSRPSTAAAGVGRGLLDGGRGRTLRAQGLRSVTIGADAPFYLWPGVEARETALLCLLERLKYARTEANFNMDLDLATIPADPGGWTVATAAERDEIGAWADAALGLVDGGAAAGARPRHARDHPRRRGDRGRVRVRREPRRLGRPGRGASRPHGPRRGRRAAARRAAPHARRRADTGSRSAGSARSCPYARVGATVGRVFFTHRKELR